MKKIVSVIKPFTITQNIFVYDGVDKIATYQANLDEIQETILNLVKEYQIYDVNLVGFKKFSKGIKEKIEQMELNKYKENTIKINIIN